MSAAFAVLANKPNETAQDRIRNNASRDLSLFICISSIYRWLYSQPAAVPVLTLEFF